MKIDLGDPSVDGLTEAVRAVREWQHDDAPMQLHPGDLGWLCQLGADAAAAAVRTWTRDGRIVAAGMLDGPELFRVTFAPEAMVDVEVAQQVAADLAEPGRGILSVGRVAVEAPNGAVVQDLLSQAGWRADEPWTPLRRDLTEPVPEPGKRIEVVGPDQVSAFTAVHRSAFGTGRFTDQRWHTMAGGFAYADARSLLAYDDENIAVAAVTVWSAGPAKPGLLEPMGVHAEHRGRGHGKAICLAAAAALQWLGASKAVVCTPSANTGAVATYQAAGFTPQPERRDRYRDA